MCFLLTGNDKANTLPYFIRWKQFLCWWYARTGAFSVVCLSEKHNCYFYRYFTVWLEKEENIVCRWILTIYCYVCEYSCTCSLCTFGCRASRNFHKVWRLIGVFLKPWWTNICWKCSGNSTTSSAWKGLQFHVLLLISTTNCFLNSTELKNLAFFVTNWFSLLMFFCNRRTVILPQNYNWCFFCLLKKSSYFCLLLSSSM